MHVIHQTPPLDTHMNVHADKPSLAVLSSLFTLCRGGDAPLLFTSICHSSSITLPASTSPSPSPSLFHTHTNTNTLHTVAMCCIIQSSPSNAARKAHTAHKYKQVTEATLSIRFITHSRGGLTHQHTLTHTLKQNALNPASLFVADGGRPTASGAALILLGGKNQINEQVMKERTSLYEME